MACCGQAAMDGLPRPVGRNRRPGRTNLHRNVVCCLVSHIVTAAIWRVYCHKCSVLLVFLLACLFNSPVIPDPVIQTRSSLIPWSSCPSHLQPLPSLVPHYLDPLTCSLPDCLVCYFQARPDTVPALPVPTLFAYLTKDFCVPSFFRI